MKRILICLSLLGVFQISNGQKKSDIKNIAIFLQENVEILDFAGPMEVFIAAGFNVYTVAESTEPMKAMHTLTVVPDYSIDNAPDPDIMVFVGGGNLQVSKDAKVQEWVRNTALKTQLQFTVCTGAFFLAEVGLLDNMIATTYHKSIEHLRTEFPKIDVRDNVRFVDNGKIITTAGISAGIDGALHVVSKLKGEIYARQVARDMEYDKWIPKEGLIVKDSTAGLYLGELLNFSNDLAEQGRYAEAEKFIRSAINRSHSADVHIYEYLRKNYLHQDKEVPPTSTQFVELIRNSGLESAEKSFEENQRKFRDWIFVDSEDLIELAYLDFFLKGNLQKALEIQAFAKRIFPEDAYVTYVLGVYHEKNDEFDKAVKLYEEALELDPTLVYAVDKMKKLKEEGKI